MHNFFLQRCVFRQALWAGRPDAIEGTDHVSIVAYQIRIGLSKKCAILNANFAEAHHNLGNASRKHLQSCDGIKKAHLIV